MEAKKELVNEKSWEKKQLLVEDVVAEQAVLFAAPEMGVLWEGEAIERTVLSPGSACVSPKYAAV